LKGAAAGDSLAWRKRRAWLTVTDQADRHAHHRQAFKQQGAGHRPSPSIHSATGPASIGQLRTMQRVSPLWQVEVVDPLLCAPPAVSGRS